MGKEVGEVVYERGGRFSSTRSFKNGDPFRNAGEELVDRLEVFFFEVRELFQNLVLSHSGGQIRCQIVDGEAEVANAGLTSHLSGFYRDARIQSGHRLPPLLPTVSFYGRTVRRTILHPTDMHTFGWI